MDKQNFIIRESLRTRIKEFLQPISSPKLIFAHPDLISLFNFACEFKFRELLGDKDKLYEFEED